MQVSQERPCCFQVVALDCASQAIRLGRCHELSSLNLKTMLASIWRVLFGTEWKPGKSAAASGVNLQLSAAIWVWYLGNEWHQQVTKTGHQCHSDHQDFQVIRRIWATQLTFALSRLVLQRCVAWPWTATVKPLTLLRMALRVARAWVWKLRKKLN